MEGVAERSLGRQIFTRNTLPHRRPPKHFLTIGKLGSCPNEGERWFTGFASDPPTNLENTLSAGVGVAPKINHRQVHGWRHATPTPERMPARGMGWNDRREWNERREWNSMPAGRG